MGRDLHYRPGSFYRKDDFSGFPVRAERTQKVWTGMIVDQKRWEPRQPQDLVKGVPDYQAVPEPRPLPPNQFVGPLYLQLADSYGPGADQLAMQSVAGVTPGDIIGVMMNDGAYFQATALDILADAVLLIYPPLAGYATSGASVVDYRRPAMLETESGEIIETEDGQPIGFG